jgi:hypothetical protein
MAGKHGLSCLPSKCKALSSTAVLPKKKKEKEMIFYCCGISVGFTIYILTQDLLWT